MNYTNKPPTMTPQEQENERAMIDAFIAQHGVTRLKSGPQQDKKHVIPTKESGARYGRLSRKR